MTLSLRRATPADHEQIGAITAAAYEPFTLGVEDDYVGQLSDAARRDREAELWVAEADGRLLGSVMLCPPESPWREIARPGEAEFRMLSVAPEAQGQGVGDALIGLALDRAIEDQCTGVVLSSLPEMTGAHRLYERRGFVRAPDRDWSPVPVVFLVAFEKVL